MRRKPAIAALIAALVALAVAGLEYLEKRINPASGNNRHRRVAV